MTGSTISIGFEVDDSYNQAAAAAGLASFTNDDAKLVARAYIADVNRHGGVLGRRLAPVFANYSVNSSQSTSSQEQAMCETWTHDSKVFAALAVSMSPGRVLDACLSRAGVVQVGGYSAVTDQIGQQPYPLQWYPTAVSADRFVPAYLAGLGQARWFGPHPVVALLSEETPVFRRAGSRIQRLLQEQHLDLRDSVYVNLGDGGTEKTGVAQLQNAILRFATEGVTHVLVLADIGDLYYLATTDAESQMYRPLWGVTSSSGPALQVGSAPDAQLANTTDVGWLPQLDRGPAAGTPVGPGYAHCVEVLKQAGIQPSSPQAEFNDVALCEQLSLLVTALQAGGTPNASALKQGTEHLDAFRPATTYHSSLAGRYDGATTYRVTGYRASCSCFEFVTPARSM